MTVGAALILLAACQGYDFATKDATACGTDPKSRTTIYLRVSFDNGVPRQQLWNVARDGQETDGTRVAVRPCNKVAWFTSNDERRQRFEIRFFKDSNSQSPFDDWTLASVGPGRFCVWNRCQTRQYVAGRSVRPSAASFDGTSKEYSYTICGMTPAGEWSCWDPVIIVE
jgi:hypothetical protein